MVSSIARSVPLRIGMLIHTGVTGNFKREDRSLSMLLGNFPAAPRLANLCVSGDSFDPLACSGGLNKDKNKIALSTKQHL